MQLVPLYRVELQDGQSIVFTEVRGMMELNDGKPRKIKNVKAHSFMLEEDTTAFGAYTGGGIVTQVKETKVLAFKTLAAALEDPGDFLLSDFAKMERSPVLHLGFKALEAFSAANGGALPKPGNDADAAAVVAAAKEINDAASAGNKLDDVDPDGGVVALTPGCRISSSSFSSCSCLLHGPYRLSSFEYVLNIRPTRVVTPGCQIGYMEDHTGCHQLNRVLKCKVNVARSGIQPTLPGGIVTLLAKTSSGMISPMCAMFGGVMGQEVVKAGGCTSSRIQLTHSLKATWF
jgi:hypothetical protein